MQWQYILGSSVAKQKTQDVNPLGCLLAIMKQFSGNGEARTQPAEPLSYPYQVKDKLITDAERSFYGVLKLAAPKDLVVFPQICFDNFLSVKHGTQNYQAASNKIRQKHVDFLLCESETLRPILAIELDDSSHKRKRRQERDRFVDQALDAAGFPILHITAARSYNTQELAKLIRKAIGTKASN